MLINVFTITILPSDRCTFSGIWVFLILLITLLHKYQTLAQTNLHRLLRSVLRRLNKCLTTSNSLSLLAAQHQLRACVRATSKIITCIKHLSTLLRNLLTRCIMSNRYHVCIKVYMKGFLKIPNIILLRGGILSI